MPKLELKSWQSVNLLLYIIKTTGWRTVVVVMVVWMISITGMEWVEDYDRKMRDADSDWDTLWLSQPRNLHQILLPRIISNVSLKPSLTEQSRGRDHIRPLRGNHGMVGFIIITDSTNGHQSGCQWLPRDWETCPGLLPASSPVLWLELTDFKQKIITGQREHRSRGHIMLGLDTPLPGDNTPLLL